MQNRPIDKPGEKKGPERPREGGKQSGQGDSGKKGGTGEVPRERRKKGRSP